MFCSPDVAATRRLQEHLNDAYPLYSARTSYQEVMVSTESTPTVAGDVVLFLSEDGLTALSRATGDEQWTTTPVGVGHAIVTPGRRSCPG